MKNASKMKFQNLEYSEILLALRDDVIGGFDVFEDHNKDIKSEIHTKDKNYFILNIPPYLLNKHSNLIIDKNVNIIFYTDYENDFSDVENVLYCLENDIPKVDNHLFIKDIEVDHTDSLEILNSFFRLYKDFHNSMRSQSN